MYMHKKNIYNACDFKTCLDVKLKFKICSNLIAKIFRMPGSFLSFLSLLKPFLYFS